MTENEETPQIPVGQAQDGQALEDQSPDNGVAEARSSSPDSAAIQPDTPASAPGVMGSVQGPSSVPVSHPGTFPGSHPAPLGMHPGSHPYAPAQAAPHAPVPPISPWAPNPVAPSWQPPQAHAPAFGAPGHFGQPPSWPPPGLSGPAGTGEWPGSPVQHPARHKARGLLVTAVVFTVAVTGMLGALVGHAVWQSTTTSSTGLQSTGTPFKTSNGGSGSGSTAPKGTSASAIASSVDPGLVDVNTTLGYQSIAGAGTGMVLTSNGLVLTNNHVVEGETSISVTDIGNHRTYSATVVGYDRTKDVALIQMENASGLTTVTLSTSSVSVGDHVVAIGNAGRHRWDPELRGRDDHEHQPIDHSFRLCDRVLRATDGPYRD